MIQYYKQYSNVFKWALFVVSIIIIGIGKWHHEMWLDEWQAMSIVKKANNPFHLYNLRKYEGHPYLYYLLLYLLSFISTGSKLMSFVHFLFAIGCMYFLIIKSNFSFLIKCCLTLSLYFIWEYTVLNRMYILLLFFLFWWIDLLKNQKDNLFYNILLTSILCQLSVYGAGLSLLPIVYILFQKNNILNYKIKYAISVFINFLILFISIKPPSKLGFTASNIFTLSNFETLIRYFNFSFFTHHNLSYNQWNYLYFFPNWLLYLLFIAFLMFSIFTLHQTKIKLGYITAIGFLMLVNLSIGAIATRHIGFYFIIYLASLWLDKKPIQNTKLNYFLFQNNQLLPFLLIQIVWGLRMYYLDYKHPFSLAKKTSEYLNENFGHIKNYVAYGDMSICEPEIYLNKPITYLINGKTTVAMPWNNSMNNVYYTDTLIQEKFTDLPKNIYPFVLIMNQDNRNYWLKNKLDSLTNINVSGIKKMPEFLGAIVGEENYYLYLVEREVSITQ